MINYQDILNNGIVIKSSGTSGAPKEFFQSPEKLKEANKVAIASQQITTDSRIYTCCKITHAGGLLAQTLPALSLGATVDIEDFNAYTFVKKIKNYTHTHITPLHARAIMMTKGFLNLDLTGLWITCGAEPVHWDIIEQFVERGATFMVNWGMSEIGPIAINTVFDNIETVKDYKRIAPPNSTILGNTAWCEFKIIDDELAVKGPICIVPGWYMTQDKVVMIDSMLYYLGRTNKDIDLWKLQKG